MLSRARLLALPLLLFLALLGAGATPAHAAPPPVVCKIPNLVTGLCDVTAGRGGHQGGGSSGGKPSGTAAAVCKDRDGTVVPCRNASGAWWSSTNFCYASLAVPQPPKTDPVWAGHTSGAVYDCVPVSLAVFFQIWLPGPGPVINPAVLAQQAIKSMGLQAITVGIVPTARPGSVGLVGLPTWMWVANPAPGTVGPVTRTASAGGFTVTATARVDRVVWRMGDGQVVTCFGRGTPYQDVFGAQSSPDCGYRYARAGRYTVTATSYWLVDWVGIGQRGQIPLNLTQNAVITMGEAQVLSQ